MDEGLTPVCKELLRDATLFSAVGSCIRLRSYQVQVANAIIDSAIKEKGLSFVVIFPRQSGKNELQAQIEAYLLSVFSVHRSRNGKSLTHLETTILECHATP